MRLYIAVGGDWNAFGPQPVTTPAIRSTGDGRMTIAEFKIELAGSSKRAQSRAYPATRWPMNSLTPLNA